MDTSLAISMFLHALFALLTFFGVTCMVIWLARFADKKQLKTWAMASLVFGLLGLMLTSWMLMNNDDFQSYRGGRLEIDEEAPVLQQDDASVTEKGG